MGDHGIDIPPREIDSMLVRHHRYVAQPPPLRQLPPTPVRPFSATADGGFVPHVQGFGWTPSSSFEAASSLLDSPPPALAQPPPQQQSLSQVRPLP